MNRVISISPDRHLHPDGLRELAADLAARIGCVLVRDEVLRDPANDSDD